MDLPSTMMRELELLSWGKDVNRNNVPCSFCIAGTYRTYLAPVCVLENTSNMQ